MAAWHNTVLVFITGEQYSSYDSFQHAAGRAGLACQDNVPYTTGAVVKVSHSLTLWLWHNMCAFDLFQLISLHVVSRCRAWHITHLAKKIRNIYLAAEKDMSLSSWNTNKDQSELTLKWVKAGINCKNRTKICPIILKIEDFKSHMENKNWVKPNKKTDHHQTLPQYMYC